MPTLVIHPGNSRPIRTLLDPGIYSVGRESNNVIAIDDPSLSEAHCELEIREDGSMRVRDLGSAEGTCVGNNLVAEADVKPGEVVRAGGVRLWIETFSSEEEEAPPEEPLEIPKPPVTTPVSFFASVPGAFSYALQGEFLLLILGAVLIENIHRVVPVFAQYVALIMGFLLGIYVTTIWRDIVLSTTEGHDRIPPLGRSTLDWDDTKELLARCFILGLICFGPAIAIRWWLGANTGIDLMVFGLGCLYFPTAFLAMLVTDTLGAANPVVVFRSLVKAPFVNLFLAFTLAGWLAMPTGLGDAVALSLNSAVLRWIAEAVLLAFALYLSFVWMRWLGLFHRSQEEDADGESADA
ncbi:MAG TPA: FHA domain-containing protein [Candidatus Paceibacterota bacterium]|nr:FHA domain-containing protein [Verrucomicrobiota bacterium]HRY49217.1 FHA domain-containing protein [Candidatus Paceibacterota bacterium]HSA03558.1 FHA domain-containing protein [Candidatus Paceibacterota bacterium]